MFEPFHCIQFVTSDNCFSGLALKHTLKLFDTGSSVIVKVEFHISISLRLLGAFSNNGEKPFFVVVL